MKRIHPLIVASLCAVFHLHAQSPQLELLAEFGMSEGGIGSSPTSGGASGRAGLPFTKLGNELYVAAQRIRDGRELYRIDVTTSAVTKLTDIAGEGVGVQPGRIVATDSFVYFAGVHPEAGEELWVAHGASGEADVIDVWPGRNGSVPQPVGSLSDRLFFVATTGSGRTLFVVEGLASPPTAIQGPGGRFVRQLGVHDGMFYFATRAAGGDEIWASDGTTGTAILVAALANGARVHEDGRFLGSRLLLSTNALGGPELRSLDVASGQSELLAAIHALPGNGVQIGGTLYFRGQHPGMGGELWKTRGEASSTELVKDVRPGEFSGVWGQQLLAVDDLVYFVGWSPTTRDALWVSDGTETGTRIADDPFFSSRELKIREARAYAGAIFFAGSTSASGVELYMHDGRVTRMIADTIPGYRGSDPMHLTPVGDRLVFAAEDPYRMGRELYSVDALALRIAPCADIESAVRTVSGRVSRLIAFEGRALFRASRGTLADGTWITGPQQGSARLLAEAALALPLGQMGGDVYFVATDDESGSELWRTDGTVGGTHRVADVIAGPDGGVTGPGATTADTVWFAGRDAGGAIRLFRSDGTRSGTRAALAGFAVDPTGVGALAVLNGTVYFGADGPNGRTAIYRTDGTESNTALAFEFPTQAAPVLPRTLTQSHGLLYMTGPASTPTPSNSGTVVYVSDGTQGGLTELRHADPDVGPFDPHHFTTVGDWTVFSASNPERGSEVWKTQGTIASTGRLTDIHKRAGDSLQLPKFVASPDGKSVWYTATNGTSGFELQQTFVADGLTRQVGGEMYGGGPGADADMVFIGNDLVVGIEREHTGTELFVLRGAAALAR